MSYRIEYGPPVPPQYVKKPRPLHLQIMTAVCLLLFSLLVRQFFPAGTNKLRQILLPGTPTVTQQALETFLTDVRTGAPVGDAFYVFCSQIISHDAAFSD